QHAGLLSDVWLARRQCRELLGQMRRQPASYRQDGEFLRQDMDRFRSAGSSDRQRPRQNGALARLGGTDVHDRTIWISIALSVGVACSNSTRTVWPCSMAAISTVAMAANTRLSVSIRTTKALVSPSAATRLNSSWPLLAPQPLTSRLLTVPVNSPVV